MLIHISVNLKCNYLSLEVKKTVKQSNLENATTDVFFAQKGVF